MQGNKFADRSTCNHHTCRMGGSMPGHALQPLCHIQQLMHPGIRIIQLRKFLADFHCPGNGHIQLPGDQLCHPIAQAIGQRHCPARVPDCRPGFHGIKSNDLCHPVTAVFFDHIVNDPLPALDAEINIKVRHADTLRIQEALKQQVVAHGINAGDANAVSAETAGTRASSRANRHPNLSGVADKIPHDQKIIHIAHLLDDTQLILHPFPDFRCRILPVPTVQPLPAQLLKKSGGIRHPIHLKCGQLQLSKGEFYITLLSDPHRIGDGIRRSGEQLCHFRSGFHIEFVRFKAHAGGILHGLVGLDTQQHML